MLIEGLIVGAVFLLAGAVKGVIGLGLPTVALALLTASVGLESAMALMLAPSFITNVWQALSGGTAGAVLKRTWPFLIPATIFVWPGVSLGADWESEVLAAILGGVVMAYGAFGMTGTVLATPHGHVRWVGPLAGAVNGVLTGLTGSFAVPGVPYLQSLSLPRDQLIQAMGMLFTCSTVALAISLAAHGKLPPQLSLSSALAILPALAGMSIGKKIRGRLSEAMFRRTFFIGLILLGAYLLVTALLAHFSAG